MLKQAFMTNLNFIRHILFACLILICIKSNAQPGEPIFKHITPADGLPSSEVYDVLQDHRGYMWFATDHGVARYDGYDFDVFTTEDGLVNNTVFNMMEDHYGRIWFNAFRGGLCWFDYNKNRIVQHPLSDTIKKIVGLGWVTSFYLDSKDTLWFSPLAIRGLGLYKIISDTVIQSEEIDTTHFSDHDFFFLKEIGKKGVVFGRGHHVDFKHGDDFNISKKGQVARLEFPIRKNRVSENRCHRISDTEFIVSVNQYLMKVRNDSIVYQDSLRETIIAIHQDRDLNIWIGSV
jgi:hypothetical protein